MAQAAHRVSEMSDLSFSAAGTAERARAYATLVSAFADDPVERWLYPDSQQYRTHFPEFLAALGGRAFDVQSAWQLGEFSAVALWLPPGTAPDGDTIVTVLTDSVAPGRHEETFAVLEQMDVAHPEYPHWYLPWFGVDATLQGTGLGGQLMRRCLRFIDESRLPAYLETPNPRSIPFYERYGFAVTGEAQAGSCPPLAFMLRAAQ
jgi:GNAT superfamily N-acetyltransferase